MSIKAVTGLVTFKKLISSTTDDWIDKLNHVYTVTILIILATIISTNQFVGDPIFCWVPAEFTSSYEAYAKWYCWIKNTYFVPMSDAIPIDVNVRSNAELTYYQWVPLILMFMAFMFKFPNLLWTMMNTRTGLNLVRMVSIAEKVMLSSKKERYNVVDGLTESENWHESPRFPRVTLCDFRIRQLENIQRYTVQCVLPINLFNEKVFIFLWFWYFFIAVLSCVNLFKWFLLLVMRKNNYMFVRKYLKVSRTGEEKTLTFGEKKLCHRFAEYYLRDDGCFVLRMLALNSSDVIVSDLVGHLWERFKDEKDKELRKKTALKNDDADEYPDVPYIDQVTEKQ